MCCDDSVVVMAEGMGSTLSMVTMGTWGGVKGKAGHDSILLPLYHTHRQCVCESPKSNSGQGETSHQRMSDKLYCVCLFGFGLCVWQCCGVALYSVISIVNAPHTHVIVPVLQPEETAGSFFMFPAHKATTTSIQMLHQGQNTQLWFIWRLKNSFLVDPCVPSSCVT